MQTSRQISFKKQLIKKLHTIKTSLGISDDQYRTALASFHDAEHSTDLSIEELSRLIDNIQSMNSGDDLWRKRCMAAIGGWLRAVNRFESSEVIKGIACRASGYENFNSIPAPRLRDIYYEFTRKAKTANNVSLIVADEFQRQIISN